LQAAEEHGPEATEEFSGKIESHTSSRSRTKDGDADDLNQHSEKDATLNLVADVEDGKVDTQPQSARQWC
jgi:hypothetical protein